MKFLMKLTVEMYSSIYCALSVIISKTQVNNAPLAFFFFFFFLREYCISKLRGKNWSHSLLKNKVFDIVSLVSSTYLWPRMIKHIIDGLRQKVGVKDYMFLGLHGIIPWGLQLISSKFAT